MAQSDGLVLPAWIGPAKLFVWSKGKAYRFGLFVLSDRVVFATREQLLFDDLRASITFEWPRVLAGAGCRLRTRSQSCLVAFGRPFPDAPAPDQEQVEGAAAVLEGVGEAAAQFSGIGGLVGGALGDLVGLAQSVSDLKKGRHSAEQVKAMLA